VFETAIDVVDGNGDFVNHEVRNVAFYLCRKCEYEIPYTEFIKMAALKK